ncbi:MAG: 2,3-bisphosphoglycerate-dependent phosphoglycerate mutase [Chlamydiia bacterium]|nr:2,3-bisphosphoglycerate-dependent phosphoglycerate mutase [Chlamydiia bacterium]
MLAKLILMRHGQSVWNKENLFTGWVDIPLSEEGIREAVEVGKKIKKVPIDTIFTSSLARAHMTVFYAFLHHASGKIPIFKHAGEGKLEQWSKIYSEETLRKQIPVYTAWELNERMYGALQGLNKEETAKKFGADQVHKWRRSYDVAPPEGESLSMTIARTLPYFQKQIVPRLEKGENVCVVAHGNSLRGIVMHLDGLTKEEVVNLEISTGQIICYQYDQGRWIKEA